MMYPMNDEQFEEVIIKKVYSEAGGWILQRADDWSFYINADSPVVPVEGMIARFYGPGVGCSIHGLFLDGLEVFYHAPEQEKEHHEDESSFDVPMPDWAIGISTTLTSGSQLCTRDGRTLEVITPEIVAELFSGMKSDEQARFFNAVGECVGKWDIDFYFQLLRIAYDPTLNTAGRAVMRQIGEYSMEKRGEK